MIFVASGKNQTWQVSTTPAGRSSPKEAPVEAMGSDFIPFPKKPRFTQTRHPGSIQTY